MSRRLACDLCQLRVPGVYGGKRGNGPFRIVFTRAIAIAFPPQVRCVTVEEMKRHMQTIRPEAVAMRRKNSHGRTDWSMVDVETL